MEMLNRLIVESLRKSSHFACHSKPSGEWTELGVEKSLLQMMNSKNRRTRYHLVFGKIQRHAARKNDKAKSEKQGVVDWLIS
jgi:hypothetical protein